MGIMKNLNAIICKLGFINFLIFLKIKNKTNQFYQLQNYNYTNDALSQQIAA
jgi:hypothetical protein